MNSEKIATKSNLRKRMLAGLVDYILLCGTTFVMFIYFGEKIENGYQLNGFPALVNALIWFGYLVVIEVKYGGTLGNLMFDLQVVSIKDNNTTSLTLWQSFKRHLFDIFDLWFFGFLGILLIKKTRFNQRFGDLCAGTIVIDTKDSEQFYKRFV